jgi:preprotein translocase subunit SecG
MYVFVVTFHIVLSVLLVLIILMQPGKGADVSSAFGGGASSQLFGSAGDGNFLTRGTGAVAALFMVTSITLALYSTEANMGSGGASEEVDKVLQEGGEGEGFGAGGTSTAPPTTPAPDAPVAPSDAAPATTPTPGAPVAPSGTEPAPSGTTPAP